jgi:GDP/UDP-N,N'-diacetylbacillosamine 2-epimerase (hydrolysing)
VSRKKRIAVVTGTRAEFGLLEPVLKELHRRSVFEPRLIVTGAHLLRKFGHTIDHIRAAGWRVDAEVKMQTGQDDRDGEAQALGKGITGISKALEQFNSEIVVVLGDRIEAFAGACAASTSRRVLAHLHGGDKAAGDLDGTLRDAITRLAHVHFVASKQAEQLVRKMGEHPKRIYQVGAPGLDAIRQFRKEDRRRPGATNRWLKEQLGGLADGPFAVVVQHPCGRSQKDEAATMKNIVAAVERCNLPGVVIYPNSDPGHDGILKVSNELENNSNWRVFRSLPREYYLQLMSRAAVQVGNSSSAIIESASLGINAVNIGPRQKGRLRCGPNVLDAGESSQALVRGIRRALAKPCPQASKSLYGDGTAGQQIAKALERLIITPQLLKKTTTF